jgi:hypothetical protein
VLPTELAISPAYLLKIRFYEREPLLDDALNISATVTHITNDCCQSAYGKLKARLEAAITSSRKARVRISFTEDLEARQILLLI